MPRKPPLLAELAPAVRADRWRVQHGGVSVVVAAPTAWEAWRLADLRDAHGAPLPFGSVRVSPEAIA